jgi:threonine dehydrogenase-like Zn-dependent dehydrogenase
MKALICMEPGKMEYADIAEPEWKAGHAIVRIRNICICGTDLHAYEGTQPYFNYPRILGHELSGELIDFDDAPGFQKGETVSFLPYLNCGKCIACRSGKTNCCTNLQVCGVHIDGGMADYYSIPSRLLVHAQGEFVLVMGAGPIGLGAMEFARLRGAEIIVMDMNSNKLDFCKNKLGISHIINAGDNNIIEQLKDITRGEMPTVVIDASGNRKAIYNGLHYLAHGGRYILIGLQKEELVFSHPEFHKRETTLMSSRNATREDFEVVIESVIKKLINPLSFITTRVQFKDAAKGFPDWLKPSGQTIKVVVEKD